MFQNVKLALKGMAMGIAEVIPGVSGGTIAFITGIYEELIETIKSVDATFLRKLFSFRIREAFSHIHGPFLVTLLTGMAIGIVFGVFGVDHLMQSYPEELWGFFFGLILASAVYIGRRVPDWNAMKIVTLLVGGVLAFLVTMVAPVEGSENLPYVFVCGVVAISALILPGISGSFILLLLGMYTVVIPSVKNVLSFDFSALPLVAVFAVGCVVGLATFSRVLSWLFRHYHNTTLAFLTGVMLGSLNKIWPWRNPVEWIDEEGNKVTDITGLVDPKIVLEENVWPSAYAVADPNTAVVIVCALAGFVVVFLFDGLLAGRRPS